LVSPIFSAAIQYQLFEQTSFSFAANQSVSPSYFENSVSVTTSASASLRQRFLGRLYLDVSGGYTRSDYSQSASNVATPSNYDATSLNVRLSTIFLKRATAALFLQKTFVSSASGSSTAALFNYDTSQYGFSLGYRF
jgi:hypothetical protein